MSKTPVNFNFVRFLPFRARRDGNVVNQGITHTSRQLFRVNVLLDSGASIVPFGHSFVYVSDLSLARTNALFYFFFLLGKYNSENSLSDFLFLLNLAS